ncbi:hypothetical protein BHM03_00048941 [Ensete ventricosum]|nr:hypothetical protein BHM03_00048941 [Ensete ventricosum]
MYDSYVYRNRGDEKGDGSYGGVGGGVDGEEGDLVDLGAEDGELSAAGGEGEAAVARGQLQALVEEERVPAGEGDPEDYRYANSLLPDGTAKNRSSAVNFDRWRPIEGEIDRRRSIEGEIDRRRSIEGEKGKKKKKRKRRKTKRRRRKKYLLSPCRPHPHAIAALARMPSPPSP